MPITDDNFEDMGSSTMPDLDEQQSAATKAPPADAAASSPATGDEDVDLLSVVRDVVKESRPDASDTAPPAEGEEEGQEDPGKPKKPDDENFSDVPFNKHPRFQQLVRERNVFRQDAERYNNVVGFIENAGLTADEAADGLTIMGLAKTNPAEAWKRIQPWVQKVLVAAGEVLPDELQQRVVAGEMSREAAIELSRAKAHAQSVQTAQSFREQQEQARQQAQAAQAVTGAAVSWEQDRRTKDPNFDTKLTAIQKEVLFLQSTEGKPNTAEGVRAQLNKAYKAVNDSLRPAPVVAARPAVRPVVGGTVAGTTRPDNMSTLDIVRANRRSG